MDYQNQNYDRIQQLFANPMYRNGDYQQKMPFYKTYPVQNIYMEELEYERDMERLKELYPTDVKKVQEYVEDECDRLEYDGSLMFDEYPDRLMLRRICERIYDKASRQGISSDIEMPKAQVVRPKSPGREPDYGLRSLIEVLLYNEMYKRRCRYRRCRR